MSKPPETVVTPAMRRLLDELNATLQRKGIVQKNSGYSESYYRAIMAGRRPARAKTVLKFCKVIGMTDISIIESALERKLTPEEKQKLLGDLSPKWRGLVAWYTFEDKTAADKSGTKNQGLSQNVRFVHDGAATAASFDGSGYILVPHRPSLSLNTFTLSAWIKPTRHGGHRRILEKGSSRAYWLYLNEGRVWMGFLDVDDYCNVKFPTPLELDRWHFVAGTFDGSRVILYLEGEFVEYNMTKLSKVPGKNDKPLVLGWKYEGHKIDYFVGLISDVQIYDRSLDPQEIQELYIFGKSTHSDVSRRS